MSNTTDKTPDSPPETPSKGRVGLSSDDLLAQINTLKDQLGTHKDLLREWKKWADMGIEDFLPKWCAPVLNETYQKTRTVLEG